MLKLTNYSYHPEFQVQTSYKDFNLDSFISIFVTKRCKSLLADDFMKYNTELNNRINHKSVLVIGGAGTIGSNYIKAIEAMFENNLLRVL